MELGIEASSGIAPPVERLFRASRLIPDEQDLITLKADTPLRDALKLMAAHDFSQLPVWAGPTVVGVFSQQSFASQLAKMRQTDRLLESPVADFLDPTEPRYVRSKAKFTELLEGVHRCGYVLVGDENDLYGIITFEDLLDALAAFAEPFFQIQLIELTVRQLATSVCSADDLQICVKRAHQHDDFLHATRFHELSLGQVQAVLFNAENFGRHFKEALGGQRDLLRGQLQEVVTIRNRVVHFTAECTVKDMQSLLDYATFLAQRLAIVEGRDG